MTTTKILTTLFLAFFIIFLVVPATQAVTSPSLNGMQIYPEDHVWNVPVDTLPIDRMSSAYISSAGTSAYLYVYTGYSLNIVDKYTPKYYPEFRYPSDPGPYPIPSSPVVETGSADSHMLIVQPDTRYFYHIFDAQRETDGSWSGGSGAVFDLSGYALRPDGMTSDAAGLPILPGLLRYEEVASGEINHALRITTWTSQDAHIWPARHHSGIDNTAFPPMGQRFRLKASVDISKYSPQQQVVLKAMKKYGMILADNSGNKDIWGLSAVQDSRFDFDYSSFAGIHGSDFEAVDESSLMMDEDSGQARTTASDQIRIGIYKDGAWYLDDNGNGVWDNSWDKYYNFGVSGGAVVADDWNGDGKTEIGIYQNGVWYIDYNGNGIWTAGTDRAYTFGGTGWTPVKGDWNGDGKTEIGIYQNGVWYIDYNGNGIWTAGTDRAYTFGGTGCTPVPGDWNGDGKSEIGIYQNGVWHIDYSGNGIWTAGTDRAYTFGGTGWTPVTGDWNGDGKTKAGIYRNGVWYLDYNGNGIWTAGTDRVYTFGGTGCTPVVGDWNGDGKTEVGIFQQGVWYLDYNGNGIWNAGTDKHNNFGTTGFTPVIGKWS
jgi:hypothetical protein